MRLCKIIFTILATFFIGMLHQEVSAQVTSANISGMAAPAIFSEIDGHIKNGVDYIVAYRQDDTSPAQPSSVVKWVTNGKPVILRP